LSGNFDEIFEGVELDYGGDPDNVADPEILKGILPLRNSWYSLQEDHHRAIAAVIWKLPPD